MVALVVPWSRIEVIASRTISGRLRVAMTTDTRGLMLYPSMREEGCGSPAWARDPRPTPTWVVPLLRRGDRDLPGTVVRLAPAVGDGQGHVYVPAAGKVCAGDVVVPSVPSPKFHS